MKASGRPRQSLTQTPEQGPRKAEASRKSERPQESPKQAPKEATRKATTAIRTQPATTPACVNNAHAVAKNRYPGRQVASKMDAGNPRGGRSPKKKRPPGQAPAFAGRPLGASPRPFCIDFLCAVGFGNLGGSSLKLDLWPRIKHFYEKRPPAVAPPQATAQRRA